MISPEGVEGVDCRRVFRSIDTVAFETVLLERGFAARLVSGVSDSADGTFFVGSRIAADSKLASAYEAVGGFDPS
jgi:hypothetical protein